MITAWMIYAIVVGALLGAAGLALERLLQAQHLPTRWVWVGTIFLALAWPLGHWILETRPTPPPPVSAPALHLSEAPASPQAILPVDRMTVSVPPESLLHRLDGPILLAWAMITVILLLFFGFLLLRIRGMSRRWEERNVNGYPVLISDEWGPAVIGILESHVVLPRWCLGMDERALRFILNHELEHLRAGDLRLMTLMGGLAVFFPWNLPVWWHVSRLRTALEADCDRRVLGHDASRTRHYLNLLLEVGRKAAPSPAFSTMLSEPYATLKKRIKIMTQPLPKRPWFRGGLLLGVGGILVAAACLAPGPLDARNGGTGDEGETTPTVTGNPSQDEQVRPRFTPFIVNPTIRNSEAVMASLNGAYSAVRKEGNLGGTTEVWFFLDDEVRVVNVIVNRSSGHRELDNIALRIADIVEFSPALNRDQPVPVWVALPVEFLSGGVPERQDEDANPGAEGAGYRWRGPLSDDPMLAGGPAGEVRGRVTDASTGQPLRFVQVFVPESRQGTLTDSDGRFTILDVPEGNRHVVALMPGFGEMATEVRVEAEDPMEVNFPLQPEAILLDKLVVRGQH